jgi:hypothetical protein
MHKYLFINIIFEVSTFKLMGLIFMYESFT